MIDNKGLPKWQSTPVFLPGESQGQWSWWAAVYGVSQSRKWLKRLSSSSGCEVVSQCGFRLHFPNDLWQPTPVLLPGKSHGWRSLVGCSPWGRWGQTRLSNFTFTFHFHALGKEMATHSSVLAWRIPGAGEPGGLPSMGSHRVGHDWSDLAAAAAAMMVSLSHFPVLKK